MTILALMAFAVLVPLGIFGTEEDAQNWAKYCPVQTACICD